MNSQFKKGVIELCVLKFILEKDMYGYEIVGEISEFINISENTIYPILRRLTKENNFKTYLKESNEGPPRKYYKITNQGRGKYLDLKKDWDLFNKQVLLILNRGEKNEKK